MQLKDQCLRVRLVQRSCNLSVVEQLEAQSEPWECRLGGEGEPQGSRGWRRGLGQGTGVLVALGGARLKAIIVFFESRRT